MDSVADYIDHPASHRHGWVLRRILRQHVNGPVAILDEAVGSDAEWIARPRIGLGCPRSPRSGSVHRRHQ